jgi:GDP-4-dehydro-6-deoxy-D-mannose reductase
MTVRALITGGGGFVGAHLAAHLEMNGDEVTTVDREVDVTDVEAIVGALDAATPDVIYHLAALTHVGDSWDHPTEFTRVNVVGSKNVLDAARRVVPDACVVFVSSAEVYGIVREQDLPVHETFRAAPANPYSSSKLEAERYILASYRETGQHVIIVRPFNHVGPGQSAQFVVPALVSRLLDARDEGQGEIRVGDLSTRRDFSDVRDVVRAYRLLSQFAMGGEIFNVASGHDTAIVDIAHQLRDQIAPDVRLVVDDDLLRPVEVPVMRGSFEKLQAATGWEPAIDLSTSLTDVVREWESRRTRD